MPRANCSSRSTPFGATCARTTRAHEQHVYEARERRDALVVCLRSMCESFVWLDRHGALTVGGDCVRVRVCVCVVAVWVSECSALWCTWRSRAAADPRGPRRGCPLRRRQVCGVRALICMCSVAKEEEIVVCAPFTSPFEFSSFSTDTWTPISSLLVEQR